MVAIDSIPRIKWLGLYAAPKAVEVIFELMIFRKLLSQRLIQLIPAVTQTVALGILAIGMG